LQDKDIVAPEPYKLNDYFNQRCNLPQAFDIIINNLHQPRELPIPTLQLNKLESIKGYETVNNIKHTLNKEKLIVIQPFGRSVKRIGDFIVDSSSRSLELQNFINIVEMLRKSYAVVVMSETNIESLFDNNENKIARIEESDLRIWSSIIKSADHFIGCDSVGQHIAKSFGTSSTIIIGSTYPENSSYPEDNQFKIIDIGFGKREYCPIRILEDDYINRNNDDVIMMNKEQEEEVVKSVKGFIGNGSSFNESPTQGSLDGQICDIIYR
jgi:ADP-heptose:LPS heptosyltransferase